MINSLRRIAKVSFALIYSASLYSAGTFTVTKTTDTGSSGELRWAIQQSNKTGGGTNTINFNISGTGPFTITPKSDLPQITRPVTINGYSQSGSSANSLTTGNNATIKIVLSGNNYLEGNATQGTGNGLVFSAGSGGSTVKGLAVSGWINTGIFINQANNISILGNYIGTNPAGNAQIANQTGIFVYGGSNAIIGTANNADRNIIAGSFFYFNESACISMYGSQGTHIQNNYIGTDKTGTVALGNSLGGILCGGSTGVLIGGSTSTVRNIISGHTVFGISVESASSNTIQGNYIGADVTGTSAIGNGNFGIILSGSGSASSTTSNAITSNLIAGNNTGIMIGSFSSLGANGNTVQNNLIGTNAAGTGSLGNTYGIIINDNSNTIGGGSLSTRNLISGNSTGGVLLYGGASSNSISNNYIGTTVSGSGSLPNGYGIQSGAGSGFGAAGSNTIQNNVFGGGNSSSTLCS